MVGAAGGIGTCSTRSGRSRRSDRTVDTPPPPRQGASAGARAVLSLPAARCRRPRVGRASVAARPVQARAGTGAQGADATLLPGVSSRRSRSVRPDRTSHMPHTPLTRIALFVQVACCGVSPPAALRPARAGTRRAARPRPRPCAPSHPLPLSGPSLCRPSPYPPQPSAGLVSPRAPMKLLSSFHGHPCCSCAGARSRDACHVPASHSSPGSHARDASRPRSITQAAHGRCTA